MNKFSRLLCLCLSAAALYGMTACGTGHVSDEIETRPTPQVQPEPEALPEEETELTPDLPDTDMNGKNFNILVSHWWTYYPLYVTDIMVEELNGEGINDATFNRNMEIEQTLNCSVSAEQINNPDGAYNTAMTSIRAGDAEFTMGLFRAQQYNALCLSGGFHEISDIPYIDFTKPWWDSKYADAVGILGKKFSAISDITMNSYLLAGAVYFNKQMIPDHDLENPYELVNEGRWTWDKLFTMSDTVDMDLNGDGKYTNADRYGMTYIDDSPEVLLAAAGVTFAELDSDGIPQVTLDSEENMTKIMRLSGLLQDTAVSFNCHARSSNAAEDEVGIFMRGDALFSLGGLYYAPQMRTMDQDFGIIPYPLYDDEQEDYRIPMITVALTYVSVPVTNADLDDTGIFMEYYAYLGRRDIMPALYDKLLLGKVSRDNESSAMLDIIFNNRIFDTGMVFDFSGLRTNLRTMYHNLQEDFASSFARNAKLVNKNIEKIVKQFEELDG